MTLHSIIHIVDDYLARSQTFIYQYLAKAKVSRPVVITQQIQNLQSFPLESIEVISQYQWIRWARERLLLRTAMDVPSFTSQYSRIIEKYDGKLIHAHFGHVGYRSLKLKRRLKLPLITTFYGFDMSVLPRRRSWVSAYQQLFQEGDYFLAEGPTMAKSLNQLGCPAEKIILQPIAIDFSKIKFNAKAWDRRGPIRILMAGRFVEKKGFIYAIQAFADIRSKGTNVELRIIGDGPLRSTLVEEATKLGISAHVHFLGSVDYTTYLLEAEQAHIFLSPSVTAQNGDTEGGAPTTILEMQAAGLPIVSTYHADIPHIVRDGESALLVPERDVEQLATQLHCLIENSDRWVTMGKIGHDYVLQHHNIELASQRLEALYQDLISAKRLK